MSKFLSILLLTSCIAKKNISAIPSSDVSVSMTGSPCMDGIMGNMVAEGCQNFNVNVIEAEQSILNISCHEPIEGNFWTSSMFYSVPADIGLIYPELRPVCFDMFVNVYTDS